MNFRIGDVIKFTRGEKIDLAAFIGTRTMTDGSCAHYFVPLYGSSPTNNKYVTDLLLNHGAKSSLLYSSVDRTYTLNNDKLTQYLPSKESSLSHRDLKNCMLSFGHFCADKQMYFDWFNDRAGFKQQCSNSRYAKQALDAANRLSSTSSKQEYLDFLNSVNSIIRLGLER